MTSGSMDEIRLVDPLEQGFSSLCVMALNFKMSDWHDGLRFALEKGWLIKNGENIQSTPSGYAAM